MSDRAPTVSRFDLRAGTYEDSLLQQFLFVPVHQTALLLGRRILPQAGAVLDVGCGTGRLLRAARPCYPAAELVGVDLATGGYALRRKRLARQWHARRRKIRPTRQFVVVGSAGQRAAVVGPVGGRR